MCTGRKTLFLKRPQAIYLINYSKKKGIHHKTPLHQNTIGEIITKAWNLLTEYFQF